LDRRILLALILLELLFLGVYAAYRPKGSPREVSLDWASHWGGEEREYARAMILCNGHLYITGSTQSFGAGKSDIFLLKYSLEGLLIWNRTWGGEGHDMGRAIATDGRHLYVVGFSYEGEESRAVLLKYDEGGSLLWYRVWGPPEGAVARGVVIDREEVVYVAGYIRGIAKVFLLKYSPEGDLLWSRTWGETRADYCWAITLDDGVYLGGTSNPSPYRTEMFLVKFDFDGDLLWVRRWGSGVHNYGWALAASRGRIYQVGFTQNIYGDADVALLCYNGGGDLLYASIWGWSKEDYGWAIAIAGPYLYVVGHTHRPEPFQWSDALIVKCTRDGELLWNRTWGGMGGDIARGVVIEGDHIYITGITYGLRRGGQAFLAGYTSPNRGFTPLTRIAAAASIVDALLLTLLLATEATARLRPRQPSLP
jgi:hypothetical protein